MTIYIDENMSPYLAKGFQILQAPENIKLKQSIYVESIKKKFGQGAKDEEWIPVAGQTAACVITQDYNIHRIRHQHELCKQFELGMFYFKPQSKNGILYWDMLLLMVKNWKEISRIATMEKRPFAYEVTPRGGIKRLS
jgi:hypothetical protein